MEQSSGWVLRLITFSQLVSLSTNVQITDILLPDTFQGNIQPQSDINIIFLIALYLEGTKTGMLLDCEYNYTKEDRDSIEIKWYFKQVQTVDRNYIFESE